MISTPVTLWPLLFSWMLSTAYHCWRGLQYGVSYNPSQFSSDVIGRQWTNQNPVKCMKLGEIAGKRMRPSHADYLRTYPVFFREGVPEMVVPCDAADAWKVEENYRAAWHSNIFRHWHLKSQMNRAISAEREKEDSRTPWTPSLGTTLLLLILIKQITRKTLFFAEASPRRWRD